MIGPAFAGFILRAGLLALAASHFLPAFPHILPACLWRVYGILPMPGGADLLPHADCETGASVKGGRERERRPTRAMRI